MSTRITVINPNTSATLTAAITAAAQAVAGKDVDVIGVYPSAGVASVESHAEEAIAAVGVIEQVRAYQADTDAFVVACFGDTGVDAAREVATCPVVGMTEAALQTACLVAHRFVVITMPARTVAHSERVVRALGLEHRCSVTAVDAPVAGLVDGPSHLLDAFAEAARGADNAEAVVLGCAGLTGLVDPLTKELDMPVIDGVAAGVGIAAGLVAMGLNTSRANTFAPGEAAVTMLFRQVYTYDADTPDARTGPVDVLVEGDRISAIGAHLVAPGARVVEGNNRHLLVPGLINAHFHSPANHLKGAVRSLPLELFMLYESPADPALTPTPREAYLRTMLGAIEMLQRGITTVQDDAFLMPYPDPQIIDAVASAYRDSGIRAFLALDQPELTEAEKLPFTGELVDTAAFHQAAPADAERLLDAYDHLIGTWHGAADDRIRAAVSISAPQRVSLDYFAALDDLAERHGLPLYAHMLETKVQRTLITEQPRFAGRSLVQFTADAGLLKPHTNVIHAVWVDDADLDAIAEAGSTVVHNPVSNLRLGSGVAPWRALLDHGIPVALGTDEAICDDTVNVWTVAKTAGLIHNISGLDSDEWPTPAEILTALWRGGARATRRDDLGVIAPGMLADLAMVDLHTVAFTPLNDLREQLVHCEDGSDVVLTMVAGQVVAERGHVTVVDEAALLDEAREVFAAKAPAWRAARAGADKMFPAYQHIVRRAAATDVGFSRWVVP